MKVWLVFKNDYEGRFLDSVWSTEEFADKRKDVLSGLWGDWYSTEEYEVDSGDRPV
jgi:hypothetical protein